jgi:hypothetical protein
MNSAQINIFTLLFVLRSEVGYKKFGQMPDIIF